jgi:hypothetical protein
MLKEALDPMRDVGDQIAARETIDRIRRSGMKLKNQGGKLLELLEERGPLTALQIARAMKIRVAEASELLNGMRKIAEA